MMVLLEVGLKAHFRRIELDITVAVGCQLSERRHIDMPGGRTHLHAAPTDEVMLIAMVQECVFVRVLLVAILAVVMLAVLDVVLSQALPRVELL